MTIEEKLAGEGSATRTIITQEAEIERLQSWIKNELERQLSADLTGTRLKFNPDEIAMMKSEWREKYQKILGEKPKE